MRQDACAVLESERCAELQNPRKHDTAGTQVVRARLQGLSPDSPLVQRIVDVRTQLDQAAFAEAWEQGQALTVDEAVALAFRLPRLSAPASGWLKRG